MSSRERYADLQEIVPTRLIVAGDWHRHTNAYHAKKVIEYGKRVGADGIVHVGDLGYNYNVGPSGGYAFEKPLRKSLEENDMFMVWVDGNHENHEWLRNLPVREDGFVKTGSSNRIFWAPRGHRWTWLNVKFGALGGAFSINKKVLREGITQFSGLEQVKVDDVEKLGNEKLDVLLTHDVPINVPMHSSLRLSELLEIEAGLSRELIQKAVDNTQPDHLFAGHWHKRIDEELRNPLTNHATNVHVLNMEYRLGNVVVFDLDDFAIKEVNEMKSVTQ